MVLVMKYQLSFCEIEQLSDNIYEATINEGAIIDEDCANEAREFWFNLRAEPYNLLVNDQNRFSYSFAGSQKIGEHPLERKTAILVDNPVAKSQASTVLELKKLFGNAENKKIFHKRDEAIAWLETP